MGALFANAGATMKRPCAAIAASPARASSLAGNQMLVGPGGASGASSTATDAFAHHQAMSNQALLRRSAGPAAVLRPSRAPTIQRQCACGGTCAECSKDETAAVQTKLAVNEPGDAFELEADRVADQVMRMPAPAVQKEVANASLQRRASNSATADAAPPIAADVLRSPGAPLDAQARAFFEPRFDADFSAVRVHTDANAAESARALGARAYALGPDIVFGAGRYAPTTRAGQRLLAHELAHVLQQEGGSSATIRRDCDDPLFCTPLSSFAEVTALQTLLRTVYLPVDEAKFGATSRSLYESFLSRRPGDSLDPVIFDDPTSDIVSSFATSWATSDDQDAIIDLVGARLGLAPGGPLSPYTPTIMSVENFLSSAELNDRPINFSNPFSIAGHIAGGLGSSDAGADYRNVEFGNVTLEKVPLIGSTGYVDVKTTLHYEVFDSIDFCPGDCGSAAEQLVTVPMSRLEASGQAYDVPFKVKFVPESRSKKFFYS